MKAYLWLLMFLLWSLHSFADKTSEKEKLLSEFIESSGIAKMIETMPQQMQTFANQGMLNAEPSKDNEEIIRLMVTAWQIDNIEASVNQSIANNTDLETLKKITSFQKTALGKKLIQAGEAAFSPTFPSDLAGYIATLQQSPPSEAKQQAIASFIDKTRMVEYTAAIYSHMLFGMQAALTRQLTKGVGSAMQSGRTPSLDEAANQQIRQQLIYTSYYLYRDISPEELNEYATFYATGTGQKELSLSFQALDVAIKTWIDAASIAVANAVRRQEKPASDNDALPEDSAQLR